ncbi:MAG: head GIN domain-containing protein, partial [Burkholderiaceae bacterium]
SITSAFRWAKRARRPGPSLAICVGLAVTLAMGLTTGQARAADVESETRPVGTFKTVRLIGSADLVLKQGDVASLTVEGDKNQLQDLKVETRGDELVLRYEPRARFVWWHSDKKGPRFLLTAQTLERISTAGSGDIRAESWTAPGDFEIAIAGASDVNIGALAARKLLVRISGAGDVKIAGGVLEQNVHIAGSGDYRAGALQSATATISIGGSGDATLWARDNLSVKIAGSGDVKYYGRPSITKSIAGSGSVTGLGDKP